MRFLERLSNSWGPFNENVSRRETRVKTIKKRGGTLSSWYDEQEVKMKSKEMKRESSDSLLIHLLLLLRAGRTSVHVHQGISEGVSHLGCVQTTVIVIGLAEGQNQHTWRGQSWFWKAEGIFIWISWCWRGCLMSDYVVCWRPQQSKMD